MFHHIVPHYHIHCCNLHLYHQNCYLHFHHYMCLHCHHYLHCSAIAIIFVILSTRLIFFNHRCISVVLLRNCCVNTVLCKVASKQVHVYTCEYMHDMLNTSVGSYTLALLVEVNRKLYY